MITAVASWTQNWLSAGGMILFLALRISAADFDWQVRPGFPLPVVPIDNPMTAAKVELGRHLFYDPRLSANGKQSCGSCHRQDLAFTDGLVHVRGKAESIHQRSGMSLVNAAYIPSLTWAHPNLAGFDSQTLVSMLGDDPLELDPGGLEARMMRRLRYDPTYRRLFRTAFPGTFPTLREVTMALAAFGRTIISTRSPYDRYRYGGEPDAISPAAKRGELLFFSSDKTGCFQCHSGWNFSGAIRHAGEPLPRSDFHNTGVYDPNPKKLNNVSHRLNGKASSNANLRVPTLRNIALTAPYMHDGSVTTLEDVLANYGSIQNNSGGAEGPQLTALEKLDLLEFLRSLTDQELLTDPRWSNPWPPRR